MEEMGASHGQSVPQPHRPFIEDAVIENPLRNLDEAELKRDVAKFAHDKGLEDVEVDLQRGASVAQYPAIYDQVARGTVPTEGLPVALSEKEKRALRNEKDALLVQSRDLYITVIACAAAALVQGWDQTGSNGAKLLWPEELGLVQDSQHRTTREEWIIGAVNAAPYFAAALIGCTLTDPINSHFGRRGTIFFAAVWCFASVIGSAFANSWQTLFACRLCLGIGMGTKASTVPVFAAECAPAYFRGSIVMCWQLWVACGILLGFSANLIVYNTGSIAWRLQLGSALLPAIPLLILIYIAPESPRWYMKQGTVHHYQKAYEALKRLRNTNLQACRDLYLAHKQLELEMQSRDGSRPSLASKDHTAQTKHAFEHVSAYGTRFVQLFSVPRIRRATAAAGTVMLAQQLCGINVLAFYSSTLFSHTTNDRRTALLYSWAFGLVNTVFALPAFKTIDTFGRRSLLLCSIFGMTVNLFIAALGFLIPSGNSARTPLIAVFLFLFAAAYSPGEGPVPFTYSAEAFPLSHREVGMSFSVAVNLFFAGLLTIVFPRLNAALGDSGSLFLFVGFNVLAFVLILLLVPETAQRTLEGLTQIFDLPTRRHIQYQLTISVPYFTRRWLSYFCGGRNIPPPASLYYEPPELYEELRSSLIVARPTSERTAADEDVETEELQSQIPFSSKETKAERSASSADEPTRWKNSFPQSNAEDAAEVIDVAASDTAQATGRSLSDARSQHSITSSRSADSGWIADHA